MVGELKEVKSDTWCKDEDDPIIKKINVYINRVSVDVQNDREETKTCSPEIYILQYPLRPEARPYGDHGQLIHVRHRSYQNTLSLEYALNDQRNQCESSDENETSTHPDSHFKKQFLTATPCEFPNLSYGIGLLRGDNLYVTPVSHILQMRPDFSYLDGNHESDRLKHSLETQTNTGELEPSLPTLRTTKDSSPQNAPIVQPNSSSSLGNETPTKKESLLKSKETVSGDSSLHTNIEAIIPPKSEWHRYPAARIRELLLKEPWNLIDSFYYADSCEAYELIELFTSFQIKETVDRQKDELNTKKDFALSFLQDIPSTSVSVPQQRYIRVSGGPNVQSLKFSSDFKEYLETLCNVRSSQPGVLNADILSSGPLSYLQLFRLSPDKQILKILQHVHVESTLKIQSLLTHPLPEETFISHLNTYAHLILGNWVCKSSLIYEGLVASCRDFLIFLFLNGKTIVRETVKPYMGGLSSTTLTTLLKELSEYRDNAWHFKLPTDENIMKKYPHITQAAQTTFSKEAMKVLVTKIQSLSSCAQSTANNPTLNQNSDHLSDNVNGLLMKSIEHVLTVNGIQCTGTLVTLVHKNLNQEIEKLDPAVKSNHTAALSLCQESEIENILPRIADNIGCNFWALRKHPNAQLNRHRDLLLCFIKRLALKNDSEAVKKGVTRTQILAEFETQGAPWQFPDFVLRNMLQEFFFNKSGFWVFKGYVPSQKARSWFKPMLPITINRKSRSICQLGDIYKAYYFPTTLFGRHKAYYQDIHFLFNEFLNSFPKTLSPDSFLLVFCDLFREHKFSYIYTITNTEDAIDCFNILCGVIFDCFQYPNLSQDILTRIEHILKLVNEEECIKTGEMEHTFYRCFLLLLTFGLSNAQYNQKHLSLKGVENKNQHCTVLPFNISKETLHCISDLLETSTSCLLFPQLPVIIFRLLFSKDPVRCRVCLYDGPNYYYQNRYGEPLSPFGSAKDTQEIYETTPPFLTLPYQELTQCLDDLGKLTHQVLQSIPSSLSMRPFSITPHQIASGTSNNLCENASSSTEILAQNLVSLSFQLQELSSTLYSTIPLQENTPTSLALKSFLNPQCQSSTGLNTQKFLSCLRKAKHRIHTFSKPSWRNPSGLQRPVLTDSKNKDTVKTLQSVSQLGAMPTSFEHKHDKEARSLQLMPSFQETSEEKEGDDDLNLEVDLLADLQNERNSLFH